MIVQCPGCNSGDTDVLETRKANGGTVDRRRHQCLHCGRRWTSKSMIEPGSVTAPTRSATPVVSHATGSVTTSPSSRSGPTTGSVHTLPVASGGVGGGLSEGSGSGSGSDLALGSRSSPERARTESTGRADALLTGHELTRLFGVVRVRVLGGGIEWTASPRVTRGAAVDMAEEINAVAARADVEPTMELLLRKAQRGRAGDKSAEIVKSPSFAFGAWMSQWTELREELRGKAPRKIAAGGYGKL